MIFNKQGLALKWLMMVLLISSTAMADKIVLKDGTIEESDRIWESDNYIHFILKGTQTVEIRYAKAIVDRIEREKPDNKIKFKLLEGQNQSNQRTKTEKAKSASKWPSPGEQPPPQSANPKPLDLHIVQNNKGVSFYDPRRSQRYWVSRKLKYTNLIAALESMANLYDQSSQWVENHMGEENDLGVIHGNLIRQRQKEATLSIDGTTPTSPDLERTKKKSVSGNEPLNQTKPVANDKTDFLAPVKSKGIQFYDPRRADKYWSSKISRHNTLKEAINALAKQYGVSADWIGRHLGDSNDLAEIHQNIQNGLASD